MIGNFMGYLRGKKQAHLGKPASTIKYDPVKGRYVIDGESESDEEPPPPPPTAKSQPKVVDEKPKEEQKEVSGLNAFSSVAFGGTMGRGRGRGASRGGRPGARPSSSATSLGKPS